MSYTIRYGNEPKQERRQRMRQTGYILRRIIPLLLALVLLALGREEVVSILFPWMDEAVQEAFSGMLCQVNDGASVPAALVDFCREVIGGAVSG